MNKAYFLISAMIVCVSCVRDPEKSKQEVDYVNPLTGTPQFPGLAINYSVGGQTRRLGIPAKNLSEENKYVQKATLDGKPIQRPFTRHKELIAGEKLVFEMGPKPNDNWK
ncbi:MAG: glycoside hydrolase domain-containing protein [Mangrovibacterium sp.]